MSLLDIFKRRSSAPVARERLQVLLAYERRNRSQPDLVSILREEIMAVIAKHVQIDQDYLQVSMDRGETMSTLECTIDQPRPNCQPSRWTLLSPHSRYFDWVQSSALRRPGELVRRGPITSARYSAVGITCEWLLPSSMIRLIADESLDCDRAGAASAIAAAARTKRCMKPPVGFVRSANGYAARYRSASRRRR